MREEQRDRRDWSVILILLLLGILLMLVAGQRAIQLISHWTVKADMGSNLNPNLPYQRMANSNNIQPLKPGILTPAPWNGTYLTPGAGSDTSGTVVPLVVFNPSSTPAVTITTSPTAAPPTTTQVTSTSTATATSQPTKTAKPTKKPKNNPPPTSTATATTTPPTSVVSTIDPSYTKLAGPTDPPPPGFNLGTPDATSGGGNIAQDTCSTGCFKDGSYFVVDVSSQGGLVVHATPPPNNKYDMVYYEVANPPTSTAVAMDQVIVGISKDPTGSTYYQVLNWGDNKADTNTNLNINSGVPGIPTAEVDNAPVNTNDLYKDPSSPASPPVNYQTGILIDVDTAPSHPPADTYNYVVVIAPANQPAGPSSDGGQVDSIQVTQVASPTPP